MRVIAAPCAAKRDAAKLREPPKLQGDRMMNSLFRNLALPLAMIGACSVEAQSVDPGAYGRMSFSAFDRDADGLVSKKEFDAVHAERMQARAEDGATLRGMPVMPAFADFDQDGDGQLTADEFAAGQEDRRRGGAGRAMGSDMSSGKGRGMGPAMGPGMGATAGRNMPSFTEFDLNADGTLTEDEFVEARGERITERDQEGYRMRNLGNAPAFTDIDLDGNGAVDAREFAEAQSQHRKRMRPQQ
ncbi:MAG: EF-hand domain-containing protein [Halieaceae bacterium]|jgi:Ca2+-binding EF-hand superfamily protein|nr:EF-hand domain-containing protein [Halieaceae bacterium]